MDIISSANAASASLSQLDSQSGGTLSSIFILIAFGFFFYFLLWRPQSQKAREHENLITHLAKQDEVVTAGGLLGKVHKIHDSFVVLTIADGVDILCQKSAITHLVPKGTLKSIV